MMNDNEIIKALECCINNKCIECPLNKMACSESVAMQYALDLVNRQKSDIERLRNTVKTDFLTVTEKIKLSQSEISEIRAEAIKEFAERLKEELRLSTGNNGGFVLSMINNLLKELTERKI